MMYCTHTPVHRPWWSQDTAPCTGRRCICPFQRLYTGRSPGTGCTCWGSSEKLSQGTLTTTRNTQGKPCRSSRNDNNKTSIQTFKAGPPFPKTKTKTTTHNWNAQLNKLQKQDPKKYITFFAPVNNYVVETVTPGTEQLCRGDYHMKDRTTMLWRLSHQGQNNFVAETVTPGTEQLNSGDCHTRDRTTMSWRLSHEGQNNYVAETVTPGTEQLCPTTYGTCSTPSNA